MAKKKAGGGGGGEAASKKTVQKKKQQIVEDKTFGLKNKNKSKKVQQHVASVTKNVMNSGDPRQRKLDEQRAQAKADRKARAKAAKEEQEALFGAALLAVQKKSTLNKKDGKIEAQGRDGGDGEGNKKAGTSRAMKMMYQMDAQEMSDKLKEDPNYVPTLEDEIEEQRQKKVTQLKASGKPLTKITEASFAEWQAAKRKQRAEEAKKRVEAELKKKKGGKGLSVLSGRDLFEYKRDLFQDQEEGGGGGVETTIVEEEEEEEATKKQVDEEEEDSKPAAVPTNGDGGGEEAVHRVAEQVQSDLFLEGEDEDLDDIDDD